MKARLFGLVLMALLFIPIASAVVLPSLPQGHNLNAGVTTKTIPFTYVDKKVNPGDVYVISLVSVIAKNNLPATLTMTVNGGRQIVWNANIRNTWAFNCKNKCLGPTFTVEKILPARCLPRTNKCSEDAVVLSVV